MTRHKKTCLCNKDSLTRTKYMLPHLQKLCRGKRSDKSDKISKTDLCNIKYIADCAKAVLRQDVELDAPTYGKLKKHKNTLLLMSKNYIPLKKKREHLVNQGGGFINLILPALVAGVAGLLSSKTS